MPRKPEPFSILKMKDTFDDCSETLFAAIKKQNPDVNPDSFDMALRQLVSNMGSSYAYQNMNGVIASIQESRPIYNEAGDVLALAAKNFQDGQHEDALKLFVVAMESEGIDELMDAIDLNNSQSKEGEEANKSSIESSDEEEDNEDDTESEDESDDSDDSDNEDDDDSEYSEDDSESEDEDEGSEDDVPLYNLRSTEDEDEDDALVESSIKKVIAKLRIESDEDADDAENEDDNNKSKDKENENKSKQVNKNPKPVKSDEESDPSTDQESSDKPMGGTSSDSVTASLKAERIKRAAMNKVSITGTDKSWERANKLRKTG